MGIAEDRFAAAQARVFEETGTHATSSFLTIDTQEPATRIGRVHVLKVGKEGAPPVLLIHGGNSVAAGWMPLLKLLQHDFQLYAPDRPGCGFSDKLDYRGVPFREHAVAFISQVMDGLGLPRVNLIGNSMGGYWALLFALAHPERVERVALVGEPAGSSARPSFTHRLLSTPGINRLLYMTALKPRRAKARQHLRMVVAHPERLSEAFLDMAHAGAILPGAQRAWLSMLEQTRSPGRAPRLMYALRPELSGIQCPVLLLWGDRDFCSPVWGQELCQFIPQARLEIIPDAGHMAWLDAPQAVASQLAQFLGAPLSGASAAPGEESVRA
ncbi:MAG TPA: alpha/beta fold hydrolase [Ktedonobacterales bacterium]|nr:alpha/beta fold hydrolase [Ktedonobacterales bacterium]